MKWRTAEFLNSRAYFYDGSAWIGYVKAAKTKKTIYFNWHLFLTIGRVCGIVLYTLRKKERKL